MGWRKRGAFRTPPPQDIQQQLSPQTVPQLQLQLQLQLLPQQFPQLQLLPQQFPQLQLPQLLPQPQELPQELPQQQNSRTTMMMSHRQESLFPLLKHISDTSLKDFGIFYAPGFQPEPGH